VAGGGVTEWLMVADCKSAGLTPYVGSNPTPTMVAVGRSGGRAVGSNEGHRGCEPGSTRISWGERMHSEQTDRPTGRPPAGVAQLVEHQPSKLRVAGSSPVARFVARVAQLVERILGKDEVRGSIPRASLVG
jgi:hypothetical protein